jgi:hypothetical protein
VEGAEQVLAVPRVDAGFAADGTIDLGEKGGRDMDEVKAAQQDGGGEPGDVTDDAPAQRDQGRGAFDAGVEQTIGQVFQVCQVLGVFAGREHDAVVGDSRLSEAVLKGWQPVLSHVLIGDNGDPGLCREGADVVPGRRHKVFADQNIVTAQTQIDSQGINAVPGVHVERRHGSEFSVP